MTTDYETPQLRIHVDGALAHSVQVPRRFQTKQRTINLTQGEIAGGANNPPTLRGRSIYPKGSMATFDIAGYFQALAMAIAAHMTSPHLGDAAVDTISLDYEGGYHVDPTRTDPKYKEGMSDEAYEIHSKYWWLRSLYNSIVGTRVPDSREEMSVGYFAYPKSYDDSNDIEFMYPIYSVATALFPANYITRSGNARLIRNKGHRLGVNCSHIQALRADHGLRAIKTSGFLWDHYSTADWKRPRQKASMVDMVNAARSMYWCDELVLWLGAGTQYDVDQLNEDFKEGGRLYRFASGFQSAITQPHNDPDPTAGIESGFIESAMPIDRDQ